MFLSYFMLFLPLLIDSRFFLLSHRTRVTVRHMYLSLSAIDRSIERSIYRSFTCNRRLDQIPATVYAFELMHADSSWTATRCGVSYHQYIMKVPTSKSEQPTIPSTLGIRGAEPELEELPPVPVPVPVPVWVPPTVLFEKKFAVSL